MWDFFQTVRHRHSVRQYQPHCPVEDEKLHAVLETACSAPTAGDLQSYRIVVVKETNLRQKLCDATKGQSFIAAAPVCLVFCADIERSKQEFGERGELYALQDTTIAAAYAQLAVVAAGMGSTWVGEFDENDVAGILALQPNLKAIALLSIGYPAELPQPSTRRRLDDVVEYRE